MGDAPANDAPFRLIDDVAFGEDVVVYSFANLYGCSIGDGSRIGPFVEIQRGAVVGARCKISSHSFVCTGVEIADEVFVGHGVVFSGDTLFSAGCGRLFEGTAEQMVVSLAKLAQLPAETLVYCGHEYTVSNLKFELTVEPQNLDAVRYLEECSTKRARDEATLPSSIRRERNVNPFLRCEQQTVKQAAEAKAGRRLQNSTEVFAVIRQWKDGFRA